MPSEEEQSEDEVESPTDKFARADVMITDSTDAEDEDVTTDKAGIIPIFLLKDPAVRLPPKPSLRTLPPLLRLDFILPFTKTPENVELASIRAYLGVPASFFFQTSRRHHPTAHSLPSLQTQCWQTRSSSKSVPPFLLCMHRSRQRPRLLNTSPSSPMTNRLLRSLLSLLRVPLPTVAALSTPCPVQHSQISLFQLIATNCACIIAPMGVASNYIAVY